MGTDAGEKAFEAQFRRKFKGDEKCSSILLPTTYKITRGAWEKANRLGAIAYNATDAVFGKGTETMGLLLGSKDSDDNVIRDICPIKHHAKELHAHAANDFTDGVRAYIGGGYRVIGIFHTHPFSGPMVPHSSIDIPNLSDIIFPQVAGHTFYHAKNEVRLLSPPIKIDATNSPDGALLQISETAGKHNFRMWLPGCQINTSGLEEKIVEFDMLYDKLNEIGYALSLILNLNHEYELIMAYAARGSDNELVKTSFKMSKMALEVIDVENDITFTTEELLATVSENIVELGGRALSIKTDQKVHPQIQPKRGSKPKTEKRPRAVLSRDGFNIQG